MLATMIAQAIMAVTLPLAPIDAFGALPLDNPKCGAPYPPYRAEHVAEDWQYFVGYCDRSESYDPCYLPYNAKLCEEQRNAQGLRDAQ
jgi:hypothetical protein